MARVTVVLDRAGIGAILRSQEMHDMVDGAAQRIASAIPGDVVVERYTTDRGAAAVVLRERDAAARQAKDGVFTSAAAGIGVRVVGRGGGG